MARGIRRGLGILVAAVLTVTAVRVASSPGTGRFLHYYQAVGKTNGRVALWERVVLSLVLASNPAPEASPATGVETADPATSS